MTQRKRLRLYKRMLRYINDDRNHPSGLCATLERIRDDYTILSDLPELIAQRPKDGLTYWWNKYLKFPRIVALQNAIEICRQEIKPNFFERLFKLI